MRIGTKALEVRGAAFRLEAINKLHSTEHTVTRLIRREHHLGTPRDFSQKFTVNKTMPVMIPYSAEIGVRLVYCISGSV